jgi:hypothetical protein
MFQHLTRLLYIRSGSTLDLDFRCCIDQNLSLYHHVRRPVGPWLCPIEIVVLDQFAKEYFRLAHSEETSWASLIPVTEADDTLSVCNLRVETLRLAFKMVHSRKERRINPSSSPIVACLSQPRLLSLAEETETIEFIRVLVAIRIHAYWKGWKSNS